MTPSLELLFPRALKETQKDSILQKLTYTSALLLGTADSILPVQASL